MSRVAANEAIQRISAVCTMGTLECAAELSLCLTSLRAHHPSLPILVGCTTELLQRASHGSSSPLAPALMNDRAIRWLPCLDQYNRIDRSTMERSRGVWFPTRHADFMMEKANLMERAMMDAPEGSMVAFVDCDITFLGQLPDVAPGAVVALSPHRIHAQDEACFGKYNGGFLAASTPQVLYKWRQATQRSRYFDQASLEALADLYAASNELCVLPPQHNYGFWRLQQNPERDPVREVQRFSIHEATSGSAIFYDGLPLRSIHTHFFLYGSDRRRRDVVLFNALVARWLQRCASTNERYRAAVGPLLRHD